MKFFASLMYYYFLLKSGSRRLILKSFLDKGLERKSMKFVKRSMLCIDYLVGNLSQLFQLKSYIFPSISNHGKLKVAT